MERRHRAEEPQHSSRRSLRLLRQVLKGNLLSGNDKICSEVQGYSGQAGASHRHVACVLASKRREVNERYGRTCFYAARKPTDEMAMTPCLLSFRLCVMSRIIRRRVTMFCLSFPKFHVDWSLISASTSGGQFWRTKLYVRACYRSRRTDTS